MKNLFVFLVIVSLGYFLYKKYSVKENAEVAIPKGWKADTVKVDKSERELYLCRRGQVFRRYTVFLGDNPVGHKQCEGDERTPEGLYTLDWRMAKGSCCYKSIHVSYPNKKDRAAAKKNGCNPGGNIMIHGILNGWTLAGNINTGYDWTNGCIGMKNEDIEMVWKYVKDGTPIFISD